MDMLKPSAFGGVEELEGRMHLGAAGIFRLRNTDLLGDIMKQQNTDACLTDFPKSSFFFFTLDKCS